MDVLAVIEEDVCGQKNIKICRDVLVMTLWLKVLRFLESRSQR
jgi:hypothetical protein